MLILRMAKAMLMSSLVLISDVASDAGDHDSMMVMMMTMMMVMVRL